ncbi:MAG: SDR family oxidoreductase [Deltaproteobacteria bacterium]|nr:SDR family oxidoreductase [Deltaproteobacteria bacterium]MBW2359288.1 SDR family oxidoreductase [Deltaproteobacteria bacterium]
MTRLSELSRSIAGKVALVTGAASGMGRATAHLFADEGAKVAVTDLEDGAVQNVVDEIHGAGGAARGWRLDVTDAERITTVIAEIERELGGLDILVNNAGVALGGPVMDDAYEDTWQRSMDVMLTAQMRLIRAALPLLERSGEGRIVNIASTEGIGGSPFSSAYTAAKHGVVGLTRALACELGSTGVTVNCICPGPIHTAMTSVISDEAKTKFARRRVPLRRYGNPEEVAHMTLSLALPAASYVNGVTIPVDGGMTIKNN